VTVDVNAPGRAVKLTDLFPAQVPPHRVGPAIAHSCEAEIGLHAGGGKAGAMMQHLQRIAGDRSSSLVLLERKPDIR
jgi:hypothetical protein